ANRRSRAGTTGIRLIPSATGDRTTHSSDTTHSKRHDAFQATRRILATRPLARLRRRFVPGWGDRHLLEEVIYFAADLAGVEFDRGQTQRAHDFLFVLEKQQELAQPEHVAVVEGATLAGWDLLAVEVDPVARL